MGFVDAIGVGGYLLHTSSFLIIIPTNLTNVRFFAIQVTGSSQTRLYKSKIFRKYSFA